MKDTLLLVFVVVLVTLLMAALFVAAMRSPM